MNENSPKESDYDERGYVDYAKNCVNCGAELKDGWIYSKTSCKMCCVLDDSQELPDIFVRIVLDDSLAEYKLVDKKFEYNQEIDSPYMRGG